MTGCIYTVLFNITPDHAVHISASCDTPSPPKKKKIKISLFFDDFIVLVFRCLVPLFNLLTWLI